MTHREQAAAYKDPETPINIPKTAKKEAIVWLVRSMCLVACLGLVAIARLWADDRYTQKTDAAALQATLSQQLRSESDRRETLEAQQQDMVRKLDLIIYILRTDGKHIDSTDMKGKMSPTP